jgi:hypothetical protein
MLEDVQGRVDMMDQEFLLFELGLGRLGGGLPGPAVLVIAASGDRQDEGCDDNEERQGP